MPKQWQPVKDGKHYNLLPSNPTYVVDVSGGDMMAYWDGCREGQEITIGDYAVCQLVNVDTPQPMEMPDALSPEIKAAIGYCWRWVIHYAEKGVGLGPDRREFMEQQASLLCAWLDGLAKE